MYHVCVRLERVLAQKNCFYLESCSQKAKEQLERMACSFPYSTNALLRPKQASDWSDAQVSQRTTVPYYILSIQLGTSIHKWEETEKPYIYQVCN